MMDSKDSAMENKCERCRNNAATLKCSICARMKDNTSEHVLLCDNCSELMHVGFLSNHDVTLINVPAPVQFCSGLSTQDLKMKVQAAKSAFNDRILFIEDFLYNLQSMRSDIFAMRQNAYGNCHLKLESVLYPGKTKMLEILDELKEKVQQEYVDNLKTQILSSENSTKKCYNDLALPLYKLIEQMSRYDHDGDDEKFRKYCDIVFKSSRFVDMDLLPKSFESSLSFCVPKIILPEQFSRVMEEYCAAIDQIKLQLIPIHLTDNFDEQEILDILSRCSHRQDNRGNPVFKVSSVSSLRRNGVFTAFLQFDHSAELISIMEWHMRYRQCLLQPLLTENDKGKEETANSTDINDGKIDLHRGDKVFALRKVKDLGADKKQNYKEFWSRGIISNISFTSCLVYFVDHGTECDVLFSNIVPAPNFGIYSHVPYLAPECTLFEPSLFMEDIEIHNIDEINHFWKEAIPSEHSIEMTMLDDSVILVSKVPVRRAYFDLDSDVIKKIFSSKYISDCDSEVMDVLKNTLDKIEPECIADFTTEIQKRLVLKYKSSGDLCYDVRIDKNPEMRAVRIKDGNLLANSVTPSQAVTSTPEIKEPAVRLPAEPKKLLIDPFISIKYLDDEMTECEIADLKKKVLEFIDDNVNDLLLPLLVKCFPDDEEIQNAYRKAVEARRFIKMQPDKHLQQENPQNLETTLKGTLFMSKDYSNIPHGSPLFRKFIFLRSDWKQRLQAIDFDSICNNESNHKHIRNPYLGRFCLCSYQTVTCTMPTVMRCLILYGNPEDGYNVLDLDRFKFTKLQKNFSMRFLDELSDLPSNVLLVSLFDHHGKQILAQTPFNQSIIKNLPKPIDSGFLWCFGEFTLINCHEMKPFIYKANFEPFEESDFPESNTVDGAGSPLKLSNMSKEQILNYIGPTSIPVPLTKTLSNNSPSQVPVIDPTSIPVPLTKTLSNNSPSQVPVIDPTSITVPLTKTLSNNFPSQVPVRDPTSITVPLTKTLSSNSSSQIIDVLNKENSEENVVTPESHNENKENTRMISKSLTTTPTATPTKLQEQFLHFLSACVSPIKPCKLEYEKTNHNDLSNADLDPSSQPLKLSVNSANESHTVGEPQESKLPPKESPLDWNILNDQSPTTYFENHPLTWLPPSENNTVQSTITNTSLQTVPLPMGNFQTNNNLLETVPIVPLSMASFPTNNDIETVPIVPLPMASFQTNNDLGTVPIAPLPMPDLHVTEELYEAIHNFVLYRDQSVFQNPEYLHLFSQFVQTKPQLLSNPQPDVLNDLFPNFQSGYEEPRFNTNQSMSQFVSNEDKVNIQETTGHMERVDSLHKQYSEPNVAESNWDDWADSVHQSNSGRQNDNNKRGMRPLIRQSDNKSLDWRQSGASGDSSQVNRGDTSRNKRRGNHQRRDRNFGKQEYRQWNRF